MKIGKLSYNGKTAESLGVFVSGAGTYNAAEEDVTAYEVPGRNGDILISNNRYRNIDVTYPAFIPSDFEERVQAIRNWMRSARSYARIEDNYDLLHFRMGVGKDILSFSPAQQNRAANCQLVFNCKPQRFLYSGEEDFTPGEWGPTETLSGDIVSFENGGNKAFKSLTLPLSPVQSFNGYDGPWPGGAGKNLLKTVDSSPSWQPTITKNADGSWKVTGQRDRNSAITLGTVFLKAGVTYTLNGTGSSDLYYQLVSEGVTNVAGVRDLTITPTTDSEYTFRLFARGGIDYDTTLYPQIEMGAGATAYEPYENICPISGWDGANVTVAGKNLLIEGYTYGNIDNSGEDRGTSQNYIRTVNYTPIRPSTTYYVHVNYTPQNYTQLYRLEYDANKTLLNRIQLINGNTQTEFVRSFTTTDKTAYIRFFYYSETTFTTYENLKIWLTLDEVTAYEPSAATVYPVTWSEAGTVYGGEVDIVSGELVVDKAMVDLGTLAWGPYGATSSYDRYVSNGIDSTVKGGTIGICSHFRGSRSYTAGNIVIGTGTSKLTVFTTKGLYASASDFKTAMNGATFVYELATPQTYQLTPAQVLTLLGANNVWSDTGPVEAEIGENPNVLENPTLFGALPLITLTNPEAGAAVTVGEYTLTCLEAYSGTVTIDCENEDIYSGPQNLNNKWSGSFPVLKPGNNPVSISGATGTIKPRWWEL